MAKTNTPSALKNRKENGYTQRPITCLTAYSTPMASLLGPHCDLLLVGDSLGTALYGMDSTLGVTLEMMINHGKAVMRSNSSACVIVDMPYGTYEDDKEKALKNAKVLIDETGADGVKLEGGQDMQEIIAHITSNGIAVMGHIGLQPQSVEKEGGYKIKGKTDEDIQRLIQDAKAVEAAGAFSVVIEGTLADAAEQITKAISIPTIGIGASAACDGQILVSEDMLGITCGHIPKFVKQYAQIGEAISAAAQHYKNEVQSRSFPTEQYTYKKKAS